MQHWSNRLRSAIDDKCFSVPELERGADHRASTSMKMYCKKHYILL
jgi:hypothetical protein